MVDKKVDKNKKSVFYFSCLIFLLCSSSVHSGDPLSPELLKQEMTKFVRSSRPNRSVGLKGHDLAYQYLRDEFQKISKTALNNAGKFYVHEFFPDVEFASKNYENDFKTQIIPTFSPSHAEYKKWRTFTDQAIAFVKKYEKKLGKNLILELSGTAKPKEVVYIGAHYDTITHDKKTMRFTPELPTEGADDNASAITALLTVAKVFAKIPHDRTIRFIAFDFEEIFFLGSYAFAKDLLKKKTSKDSTMPILWNYEDETVLGLLNLEMIGHSSSPLSHKPRVKLYTRSPQTDPLAAKDIRLAQYFIDASKQIQAKITPELVSNGFNRSDHWSFWQNGFPSVCITQDWENDFNEKNYHSKTDTIQTLNFDYLFEITKTLLETVSLASKSE